MADDTSNLINIDRLETFDTNLKNYIDINSQAGELLDEVVLLIEDNIATSKAVLADSISNKGVPTTSNNTFNEMAANIDSIKTCSGTATADKVLAGETFTNSSGEELTGTIPSLAATTYTPSTKDQTIEAGSYISEPQTILGDAELVPENILEGKEIFGVAGTAISGMYNVYGLPDNCFAYQDITSSSTTATNHDLPIGAVINDTQIISGDGEVEFGGLSAFNEAPSSARCRFTIKSNNSSEFVVRVYYLKDEYIKTYSYTNTELNEGMVLPFSDNVVYACNYQNNTKWYANAGEEDDQVWPTIYTPAPSLDLKYYNSERVGFKADWNGASLVVTGYTNDYASVTNIVAIDATDADLVNVDESTAIAAQILNGAKAYSGKKLITGTMPNLGAVTGSVPAGGSYTIQKGYHNGQGIITTASLADQTSATATAAQILSGQTAWVNGTQITGTMPSLAATTYTPGTSNQTISAGQYLSGAQTIAGSSNLVAGNIKSGVKIFNVTGSLSAAANLVMTKQLRLGDDSSTWTATVNSPIRAIIYKPSSGDMTGFWIVGSYYGYGSTSSEFAKSTSSTVTIWVFKCKLTNSNKTITISSTNGSIGSGYNFYLFI